VFYGIVESIFKVKHAVQVFYDPIRTDGHDDGIRLYLKVVNELGSDQQTNIIWIHQRALEETYHPRTPGGIRSFVHRYQEAYGELDQLGKKISDRDRADNLLKNLLCDSTRSLARLIRQN
jgi:hypothetical protein